MPLLNIIIGLVIVGVLLWLINRFVPMASSIKTILNIVVIVCVIIWVLGAFGIFTGISAPGMEMPAMNQQSSQ